MVFDFLGFWLTNTPFFGDINRTTLMVSETSSKKNKDKSILYTLEIYMIYVEIFLHTG